MTTSIQKFRALKRLTLAAGLALAASACGSDGESGAEGGSAGEQAHDDGQAGASGDDAADDGPRLTGVVAGYIEGATVFLDLNGDLSLDADEPSALTDETGQFALPERPDAASFALVALVPDTAFDSYLHAAVRDPYVLVAPAGAGTFVSPISSLVAGLLLRYPGFTLDEAEAALGRKLAVGDDLGLFDDYLAAASSPAASDSHLLQRAAQVLALSFGMDMAQVAVAADTALDPVNVFTMVTHNAELQLPTIVQSVAEPAPTNDDLLLIATVLKHVDAASLEERLDQSRPAVAADFFDTFAGDGAYIPFPGPSGALAGYGQIASSSTNRLAYRLPQSDFVYDNPTSTYVPEPALPDPGYCLTRAGWVERSADTGPVFSSNEDGSADVSSDLTRSRQTATSNAVDLSGRLIRSYATGVDLVDRGARFGEGAVAYRLTSVARSDEYATLDDYGNAQLAELTDLASVEAAYGESGVLLRTTSSLNVRLLGGQVAGFTSGRDDMSLPLRGSWQRRTVDGAELIEITIPLSYKSEFDLLDATTDLFVAIVGGRARLGTVTRAAAFDTRGYYLFNKAGFDQVMAAAVPNDDAAPIFGRVAADGYIEGATVFLDLNDDGELDAGEPETESDSDGYYELAWHARDFTEHALVAAIPANAVSRLPGQAQGFGVTQAFSLRAPPGQTFISPYSTMAWYLIAKNPGYDYATAEAELAGILGAAGSLTEYVNATDSVEEKVRLVAGVIAEKLKEARGRILANTEGVAAVLMNPDSLPLYTAMIGASYETLPGTVAQVELLLAEPAPPPGDAFPLLRVFTDELAWADILKLLYEYAYPIVEPAITALVKTIAAEVIDGIVDAVVGEIPYVGWILSPSVACMIKTKYEIACN
jgi:hypothetical protein